jgi:serine/threonine protein kinase
MKLWRYGYAIERLGKRYRLDNLLGSGAVADVCLAWDEREQREVAVKVVKSDDLDQETLGRFQQEARHTARLDHPHILHVYGDLGLELVDKEKKSIVPYIVMEYARGGDLHKRLAREEIPFEQALSVFSQICEAVQYAHDHGVIHRDIKPLNILFRTLPDSTVPPPVEGQDNRKGLPLPSIGGGTGGAEEAVLSDFGLAVDIDATHHTFAHGGTLAYMAPEQFTGYATPASDIFALGVVLYQLCTGHLPFRRALHDLYQPSMATLPAPPSSLNPAMPSALDAVIMRALNHDPAQRYASASAFLAAVNDAIIRPAPPLPVAAQLIASVEADSSRPLTPRSSLPDLDEDRPISVLPPLLVQEKNEDDLPIALSALRGDQQTPLPDTNIPEDRPIPLPALRKMANPHARRPPLPRRAIIAATIVVLLLLIGGVIAAAAPGVLSALRGHALVADALAAITITPKSQLLTDSFAIQAVTGKPSSANRQVQATQLTYTTPPSTKTVNATGKKQTPATNAAGSLTFYNATTNTLVVLADTVFTVSGGVQIENTVKAVIPGANPPTEGSVTVSARAITSGSIGNIAAYTLNGGACCDDGIAVSNTRAFSGGQDAQNYTYVQQSDVSNAEAVLWPGLTTQAMSGFNGEKKVGQQLVAEPNCNTNNSAKPPVGAKASSTTVTVAATCTGEVYDLNGADRLAQGLLANEAAKSPGKGYALTGMIVAYPPHIPSIQGNGTVDLVIKTAGVWVYQFSDAVKAQLAQLVAGKSLSEAQSLLLQQPGVASVNISIANNGATLPKDAAQMAVTIQRIPDAPVPTVTVTPGPPITPVAAPTKGNG